MAEYCLDCVNKYLMKEDNQLTEEEVTMDMDFCEGCGGWKLCVIRIKKTIKTKKDL